LKCDLKIIKIKIKRLKKVIIERRSSKDGWKSIRSF